MSKYISASEVRWGLHALALLSIFTGFFRGGIISFVTTYPFLTIAILIIAGYWTVYLYRKRQEETDTVAQLAEDVADLKRDVAYLKTHLRAVHFIASKLHGDKLWSDQLTAEENPHHRKYDEEFEDYGYMSDQPSGRIGGGSVHIGGSNS